MSNIEIIWDTSCILPDDALKLDLNISNTTNATEVFSPPEGLEFETDCDTAKITSYTGTATNVIIPSIIKHYDKTYIVTSIGDHAFENCENLISISIPDGVKNIEEHAFFCCEKLTSISIPDGVKNIGDGAFAYCKNLTSISVPDGVKNIGASAFRNCRNLTSISILNSVKNIGAFAFYKCKNLTSITIPDSVTSIGYEAFRNCSSLTSVTFENTSGWKTRGTSISSVDLANTSTAARYLTSTYCGYNWERGGTTSLEYSPLPPCEVSYE